MLLDASVLYELLWRSRDDALVRKLLAAMGDPPHHASPIHLGELSDAARRSGADAAATVKQALELVDLVPLDLETAVEGSAIKADARRHRHSRDFSLIDGIGLASARRLGVPFLTLDPEFDGLRDAIVVPR